MSGIATRRRKLLFICAYLSHLQNACVRQILELIFIRDGHLRLDYLLARASDDRCIDLLFEVLNRGMTVACELSYLHALSVIIKKIHNYDSLYATRKT